MVKSKEFGNLSNYFISKVNSPYEEVKYLIKNNDSIEKILNKFIVQFYNNQRAPNKIFTSCKIQEKVLLEEALTLKNSEKVTISEAKNNVLKKIIMDGKDKAKKNLVKKLANNIKIKDLHSLLKKTFNLTSEINKIEVYYLSTTI